MADRYFYGTGRRKTAVARVRVVPGNGAVVVNGKPIEEYFPTENERQIALQPFDTVEGTGKFNASVRVVGGGVVGQAGATSHGVARALCVFDPEMRPALKKAGLLERDARVKERKKPGLKRARKAPQYTKR